MKQNINFWLLNEKGSKHFSDSKVFIDYSNDTDDI